MLAAKLLPSARNPATGCNQNDCFALQRWSPSASTTLVIHRQNILRNASMHGFTSLA
jgi:hypothetical protein